MSYNYYEEMHSDVMDAMDDYIKYYDYDTNHDRDELEQKLFDDLFVDDSVTGNASGSYTFNRWAAQEYVLDNMDLLSDACDEFCVSAEEIGEHFISEDFEWMDVTIRCYLLSEVLSNVLDDMESDGFFEQSDEQDA